MRARGQVGQVTAFVVVFMVALIGFAGLVIDGAVALSAYRRAMNEAQAAARAGAEALNTTIYRNEGRSVIDQGAASDAVGRYMHAANASAKYELAFIGDDTVVVNESFGQSLNFFGSFTAKGHGSATTVHGIAQEGG